MSRGLLLALVLLHLVSMATMVSGGCVTAADCNGGSCSGGYCYCSAVETQGPSCNLPAKHCPYFTCTNNLRLNASSTFLNHAFEFTGFPETLPATAKAVFQSYATHTNYVTSSKDYARFFFPSGIGTALNYGNGPTTKGNVFNGTVWRDDATYTLSTYPYVNWTVASPIKPPLAFSTFTMGNGVFQADFATVTNYLQVYTSTVTFEGLDACHPNPCLNNGTCSTTNNLTYTCDCSASGYTGYRCQGCPWMTPWVAVPQPGDQGIVKVFLSAQPTSPITVTLTSDCATLSTCSLTFTPGNWDMPQKIWAYRSAAGTCQVNGAVSAQQNCNGASTFTRITGGAPTPAAVGATAGSTFQVTFEGKTYFVLKTGDFYLFRQLGGELVIQIRTEICHPITMCTTSVAVRFRNVTLFISQLNGVPTLSTVGNPASQGVVVMTNGLGNGYQVLLPTGAVVRLELLQFLGTYYNNVFLSLPASYQNRTRGLMGTYDGNPSNDLTLPDGTLAADLDTFSEAWRVPTSQDLFLNAAATIPSLGAENATATGRTCLPPSPDDITGKVPSSNGSPLANQTTPVPQTLPQPPACNLSDTSNPLLSKAIQACGPYFNDSVAQCCSSSLGVNGDKAYTNCLCNYLALGNASNVLDSVNVFYAACDAASVNGGPTCQPCPNACSGHGTCQPGGVCSCTGGYKGADCSENWNNLPTVASVSVANCPLVATVYGSYFYGDSLECLFSSGAKTAATKISNFQVTCPFSSPSVVNIKVVRSGVGSASVYPLTFQPQCCDSPCKAGSTCAAAPEGFVCQCPSNSYLNADWPATAPQTNANGICQSGYSGSPVRACGDSTWSGSVTTGCVRNTCAATTEGNATWPKTNSLTPSVAGTCVAGFSGTPSRSCDASGNFGSISSPCVPNPGCAGESYNKADWPATDPTATATGVCQAGYAGSPQRRCLPNGAWESTVSNVCQRLSCTGTVEDNATWNTTWALDTSYGTCGAGYTGRPTRQCSATGAFGAISNPCVSIASCTFSTYSNANWTETLPDTVATGTCLPGFAGAPTRKCKADGTWESIVQNFCVSQNCTEIEEDNALWPIALKNTLANGVCQNTMIGSPTRLCSPTAQWQPISNPCRPAGTCPSEVYVRAEWPVTNPGETATATKCIDGWTGAPTRICKTDGTWQTLVQNHCVRIA